MSSPDSIRGSIDRFEGNLAVIVLEEPEAVHGQTLRVPKKLLPKSVREGVVLELEFRTEAEATQAREVVARKLLEEILNGK